jgi:zinc D-Ala-D-Ala carboxypeptidase
VELVAVSKLRHLCVALMLAFAGSGLAASGLVDLPIAAAADALPECRYDDVMTTYTSYGDWQKTLVDTIYALPRSATHPRGLVSTSRAGLNGGEYVRKFVIPDLAALAAAARADGAPLSVISGYRTYKQQQYLYNREVRNKGLEAGRLLVARPGHSEHHLGTAIDFGSATDPTPGWKYEDWGDTPAGAWLKQHAWRFGFLLSYPNGWQDTTCYQYEPWHFRYVGREMAAAVAGSGLTVREYLWQNFH